MGAQRPHYYFTSLGYRCLWFYPGSQSGIDNLAMLTVFPVLAFCLAYGMEQPLLVHSALI